MCVCKGRKREGKGQLNRFTSLKPLLSPSKLPKILPTRVSTDPSIRDHPAAIGVKISGSVLEEYTFHKQGDRVEIIPVLNFFSLKSSQFDPTDH